MTNAQAKRIDALEKALKVALGAIAELQKVPAAVAVEPVDHDAVNSFDEEFLIGLWIADQRREGVKTIDLDKVETIREGMRYALELRSPAAT